MANLSKELMDVFHHLRTACAGEGDFEGAMVFDSCENMVNNLMHGRPFKEIYPTLRNIFVENSEQSFTTPAEKVHYENAIMWLDLFAEDHGVTLP